MEEPPKEGHPIQRLLEEVETSIGRNFARRQEILRNALSIEELAEFTTIEEVLEHLEKERSVSEDRMNAENK